ncbi:aminoglycoside phosphotransferase family protein [Alkaliphilus peptidifermentans]|uniref:TIGR02172 family protein n=1 Tax=Alkaliphilus peptidifermentans DSM 18978 TaxID=1120976 RepID=A0A1G5IVF0_9FIRM|nr:aminoglycoside phosphotransferase family protein [Alkaliphilus peptidifermentans]SCY79864.1 TIGR02172 family protein [Alkaliphilus peptidifermentans DSM 18978]
MGKGQLIGKGMTAEVYEWEQDKVLKLYFDWVPDQWVKYEAMVGKAVYEAGVPSPAVYDIVNEEEGKGILFQRIYGKSMLKHIENKPWKLFYYAGCMARLHVKIHSCSVDKLPTQNEKFTHAIKASANILKDKEKRILGYLESLPAGGKVCHGDFHPDNILITDKDILAIDWTNAYYGNQLSDVARTCIMITTPFMPAGTLKVTLLFSKILKGLIYSTYLKEYVKLSKTKTEDIFAWMLPVAAARLKEKIPGEEKWLLKIIDKELKRLGV